MWANPFSGPFLHQSIDWIRKALNNQTENFAVIVEAIDQIRQVFDKNLC